MTVRSVGTRGGQAAAFTYDLARSIVYTRQGNPAWSGQERDGIAPIRSDDLFFGGAQPDWVDLDKVAIPQADEQQRLLANLILHVNSDRRPLPRFWYFPRGEKAVVVMTGDDHANNGTAGRFDIYKSNSPANCNVANWECVRATSYIYPATPITNAQAAGLCRGGLRDRRARHDELRGLHAGLAADDLRERSGAVRQHFPERAAGRRPTARTASPGATTTRSRRWRWRTGSGSIRTTTTGRPRGCRTVPGFMTGSGMPMRFAKADGTMIDVYQAATQMTDESGQTLAVHGRRAARSRASGRKAITASSSPTCTPTPSRMPDRRPSSPRPWRARCRSFRPSSC